MSKLPPAVNRPQFGRPQQVDQRIQQAFGVMSPSDANNFEQVALDTLVPSPHNRFRLDEERVVKMAQSIAEHGVLHPIIVRPLPGQGGMFEILSGRHRVEGAKRVGKLAIWARMFRNLSDEEAVIIINLTNLEQREYLYPIEKAYAYHDLLNALKAQGSRNDLIKTFEWATSSQFGTKLEEEDDNQTSSQVGTKLSAYDEITKRSGDSRSQIARYIRLVYLIPEMQKMVDDERISVNAASELSYLTERTQQYIAEVIIEHEIKISIELAREMRLEEERLISRDSVREFLLPEKRERKQPSLQTYSSFIKQLRRTKKISQKEKRQMDRLAEEAAQKAADEAIRTYLLGLDKMDEEVEAFLDERRRQRESL